jgi:LysM repeat protein
VAAVVALVETSHRSTTRTHKAPPAAKHHPVARQRSTSKPRPPSPRYWTITAGESFGSIAAKTGIDITKLEELNPRLHPTTLQVGDRVRLR